MNSSDQRAAVAAAVATALGACALTPVFSSAGWVPPILAVVLVVLAGGLLLRLGGPVLWARATAGRPVPGRLGTAGVALVPVGQLVLVLFLLTARYASSDAVAGVLPTRDSLAALGAVLTAGTREIQEQATPALPLTGLVALTAVFVAVLAVVVDLVAVAGRQAALAGVGLLVLYSVPVVTITGSIGALAVAAPAAGLALLLWTDQRRRLGTTTAARVTRPGLSTGTVSALRVATAAVATGLVVGSLVPTLTEGSFATGLGDGSGTGSTGTALDPVGEMRGQLLLPRPIALLRMSSSTPQPGYLRAVSLEDYDIRRGWVMSNLTGETSIAGDRRLAPPLPGEPIRQVRATIEVLQHDDRFLPVPSFPLSVQMAGADAWRFDPVADTVYGRGVTTGGRSYAVVAAEPRPTLEILAQASPLPDGDPVQQRFTVLPRLDPRVVDTVATVIGDATGPYERVRRIHAFLTDRANGFQYSLSTRPGSSGDDLVDFLQLRRGYCEQYAGAMAVMARAAGVPARVVLGYTTGRVQSDGSRLISSDDAHAWVEVYFQGLGWVPFDPTPIATDRAADLPWAQRGDAGARDAQLGGAAAAVPSNSGPTVQRDRADGGPAAAAAGSSPAEGSWPALGWTGGAALALALLVSPAIARVRQRRRRVAAASAPALWDELVATALDVDVRMQPTWTPRRAGEELARVVALAGGPADGAGPEAVRRLARAEEAASYGPRSAGVVHPELVLALRTARRQLLAAAARPVRWRARLWPASLVTGVAGRLTAGIGRLPARLALRRGPRAV